MATPQQPPTLKYGMKIQLVAKSPQGADPKANYYITTYDKHGLVVLDENNPITWTLVPTGSTQQDVCYGDRLILVDDRGLVMNGQDTRTWGKGYISLKDRSVPGELNFHFSRPSHPLVKGSPILLGDTTQGNKLHLHAFPAKGHGNDAQKIGASKQPLTAERKSSSGCKGGYLRFNGTGSGQLIGFDIKIVSDEAKPVSLPPISPQSPNSIQSSSSSFQPASPTSPQPPNAPNAPPRPHPDDDEEEDVKGSATMSPGYQHRYHSAGEQRTTNGLAPRRQLNPDYYDVAQEVLPLRYGDKIKLTARSPYNPDGGSVGLYRKHELFGAGPLKNAKTGKLADDGEDDDFITSEFIICGTGLSKTGDIVRYSSHLVLVDASNGNAVWNCRDTETWGDGYITLGPIVQNGVNPTPATQGPPLVNSNFTQITQNGKLPTGQVHISFQPETSNLLGFPVHNKDTHVFIDVEDTHQTKGKLNSRLSVYKKKASMLTGGYLLCLPNSGKPVSFTVERVQSVPIVRKTPWVRENLMPSTGFMQEVTYHHRREANAVRVARSRERKKYIITAFTLLTGIIAFGYFTLRYKYQHLGENALDAVVVAVHNATTNGGANTLETNSHIEFTSWLGYPLIVEQFLYYKQVLYTLLTLIFALASISLNTSTDISPHHDAQTQQIGLVQVEVERNTLSSIIQNAQSQGGTNPNQWMIDAGLDPDHIVTPQRYINAEKGDADKGKKRYLVTTKWRFINQLETILERPHPLFRIIKKNTVQFFSGKDLKGNCVYYETPKAANLPEFEALGVTIDELLFHFVYITEYLYIKLDTNPDARCLSVVDLNGISMSDFGGNVVGFVQAVAKITQTHYPERSAGILCINASWAFQFIWKIVSSMMDPVTRSKTHLWGSDFVDQMAAVVAADQIPALFGGKSKFTPKIEAKGPTLPADSIHSSFNAIEIAPLSIEEEEMFIIADKANQTWASENRGQMLPRPLLKDKLQQQ